MAKGSQDARVAELTREEAKGLHEEKKDVEVGLRTFINVLLDLIEEILVENS